MMIHVRLDLDYAPHLRVEHLLTETGWTDLLRAELDGTALYIDQQGLANDLAPVLEILHDTLHQGRDRLELVVGKQTADGLECIGRLAITPLLLRWEMSALDLRTTPAPGESAEQTRQRMAAWWTSDLELAKEAVSADTRRFVESARRIGLRPRAETFQGPWLALNGEEPENRFGAYHQDYSGRSENDGYEGFWLARALEAPPRLPIVVDHHGLSLGLEQFLTATKETPWS